MDKISITLAENGYVVKEFSKEPIATRTWVFSNNKELSDWMADNFRPSYE